MRHTRRGFLGTLAGLVGLAAVVPAAKVAKAELDHPTGRLTGVAVAGWSSWIHSARGDVRGLAPSVTVAKVAAAAPETLPTLLPGQVWVLEQTVLNEPAPPLRHSGLWATHDHLPTAAYQRLFDEASA